MRLSQVPEDRIVLLLGAPRSGTTWLGKILDTHPQVLYRFEPDRAHRAAHLPLICPPARVADFQDAAKEYLRELLGVRALPVAGTQPAFRKFYRPRVLGRPRDAWIRLLRRVMRRQRKLRRWLRRRRIPDLIPAWRRGKLRPVIKSVAARGRAGLFAAAMPEARIIFLVRDPFGYVAAMLRGTRTGRHHGAVRVEELLATEQARAFGLTPQMFDTMSMVERFAWDWAILNRKALDELEGRGNVRVVSYQDLVTNPIAVCRDLFAFLDLDWTQATEEFLRSSQDYQGRDPYLRLFRNTRRNANAWRAELNGEDQQRILRVAQAASLWQFCPSIDPS